MSGSRGAADDDKARTRALRVTTLQLQGQLRSFAASEERCGEHSWKIGGLSQQNSTLEGAQLVY